MRRVEQSPAGQAVLTVLMAVLIVAVVLWNLPEGRPRQAVLPVSERVVQAVGMEQFWGLFAPDPRDFSVGVFATVTYRDGRSARWAPPSRGHVLAPYRTYRWQKYVERLRADEYGGLLWEPAARFIARELGPGVARVTLTRTFRPVLAPGSRTPRPPAKRYDFYTLELG